MTNALKHCIGFAVSFLFLLACESKKEVSKPEIISKVIPDAEFFPNPQDILFVHLEAQCSLA